MDGREGWPCGGKEGDLDKTLRKEEVRLGNSLRLEALGLCEGLGCETGRKDGGQSGFLSENPQFD